MIKRITSIIVIGICIILFTCSAMAEFKDLERDAPYLEAVDTITALDIMQCMSGNTFEPKKGVTRGEFIKYAMILNGTRDLSAENERIFYDVPQEHTYAAYINTAHRLGIINGDGNGFFYPDENITYGAAAKILSHVIGNADMARLKDKGEFGYISNISRLGISRGLNVSLNSELSRGDTAYLLYKTMFAKTARDDEYYSDGTAYITEGDKTVMEQKMDIGFVEGRVTANKTSSLTETAVRRGNDIEIEFKRYIPNEDFKDDYLGLSVKAYYRTDKSDDKKLLYVRLSDKNDIKYVNADDIVSCSEQGFTYTKKGVKDKKTSIQIPRTIYAVYNGQALLNWDYGDLKPTQGICIIIDNNNDGTADIVKVEEYENYRVLSVKTNDKKVYIKNAHALDFDGKDGYAVKNYETGQVLSIDTLSKDDIISILRSKDGNIVTVYAQNKTVSGTVDEYGDESITVNGTSYRCTVSDCGRFLGQNVLLRLDYTQSVAEIDDAVNALVKRGFILAAADGSNTFKANAEVRILEQNGEKRTYSFADRVKVDNVSGIEKKNIVEYLSNCSLSAGREKTPLQLIDYKVNEENKIYSVDTCSYTPSVESEDSLRLSKTVTSSDEQLYCRQGGCLDGVLNVVKTAKVFIVNDTVGKTNIDTDDVYVRDGSYFTQDVYYPVRGMHTKIEFYNFNDVNTSDAAVVYINDGAGSASDEIMGNYRYQLMMIRSVRYLCDDDGTTTFELRGIGTRGENTFAVSDRVYERINREGTLKRGDVIVYELLENGKIGNYKKLFSYSANTAYFAENYRDQNSSFFGKVLSCDGNYAAVNFGTESSPIEKTFYLPDENLAVYSYDVREDTYEQIPKNAIVGSKDSNGDGDIVYIYANYSKPYLIIIFK